MGAERRSRGKEESGWSSAPRDLWQFVLSSFSVPSSLSNARHFSLSLLKQSVVCLSIQQVLRRVWLCYSASRRLYSPSALSLPLCLLLYPLSSSLTLFYFVSIRSMLRCWIETRSPRVFRSHVRVSKRAIFLRCRPIMPCHCYPSIAIPCDRKIHIFNDAMRMNFVIAILHA